MRHRRLAALFVIFVASLGLPASVVAASPIAVADFASTLEDTAVTIDLLKNDSDPDGDSIHIDSIIQGADGKVTLAPVAGLVSFAPNYNFKGMTTFSYVLADAGGATATALVTVYVDRVNDPPFASDRIASVTEGQSVTILLQAYDPDKERCDLIFVTDLQPAHGTLSPVVNADCSPNGDMANTVYTPAPGYSGSDSFTYHVSDGTVQSNLATVSITVVPLPRVHVGDLDGSTVKGSGSWTATAAIRIESSANVAQPQAVVTGRWSTGATASCTTAGAGTCVIGSGSIARSVKSATFTMTSVTSGLAIYDPSANHDPDGDSTGTSITIARP
jgi:hypothetical protein